MYFSFYKLSNKIVVLLIYWFSSRSSSSSIKRCNWQSQRVCWQDTLWQPMWLIAAQPASKINACFKTVDWRRLNYFARQSVSQIRRSIKEKIFSVLLPWNFFEVFHLIIDNLKAIALVSLSILCIILYNWMKSTLFLLSTSVVISSAFSRFVLLAALCF